MNDLKVRIRTATQRDVENIQNVLFVSFGEYNTMLNLPKKPEALTETTQSILDDIKNKYVLVGIINNMLMAGTVRYEIIGKTAYISRFAVLPNWQSSGVGRMLIEAIETDCKAKGVTTLALHTATKMFKLARFYYGFGFYVHSTSQSKGYIRGLFIKELSDETPDVSQIMDR